MTDKGQIIFAFKVKWHLKSHFADAVENYRSRIFVGHFILLRSTAKPERGEKISPCLWLFSYPVSILGSCYRSAIFSDYFKAWVSWDVERGGLSTLKVQTLFFHDAWVAIASLTLSPFPGHWSISQCWPERHSHRKIHSGSLLSQSLAFQLRLPTNDCWTLARQQ